MGDARPHQVESHPEEEGLFLYEGGGVGEHGALVALPSQRDLSIETNSSYISLFSTVLRCSMIVYVIVFVSESFYESGHFPEVVHDAVEKLHLGSGPDEVVLRILYLVVCVSVDVIGEEPKRR